MAIPLKRVQLSANSKIAPNKFCAMTSLYPVVETDDVVSYISIETGLPKATIEMVLKYANTSYEHFLSIGHPVRMGNLGILKVKSTSKAQDSKEDVEAIIKPSFLPSSELRKAVKNMSTTFTDGGTVDDTGDDDVSDDTSGTTTTTTTTPTTPSSDSSSSNTGGNGGDDDEGGASM